MTRKKHPRRVVDEILARQNWLCACGCGQKLDPIEGWDIDHVKPRWLGGPDTPDNLQALRRPCHRAVRAHTGAR